MKYVFLAVLAPLLVAACGGAASTATPVPIPTPTRPAASQVAPTATPQPAATARPAPSPATAPSATQAAATAIPTPTAVQFPTPSPTPSFAQPKRGGVVKQADEPTADKAFQIGLRNAGFGNENSFASRQIYQPLLGYDAYNNNNVTGILAASWQFSDSADTVTFKIAPDAKWSDGKPVIAQDIKFMFDHYVAPPAGFVALGNATTYKNAIASTDVIDDKTVRMRLKGPDVGFLATITDPDMVIRPSHRTLEQSAKEPVGSGPFVFTRVDLGVKFTFARNTAYWMKDQARGNAALPYLDGIENIIITDFNLAYAAVSTGQLDALHAKFGNSVLGKEDDMAKKMPKAAVQSRYATASGWGFSNKAPFNNPAFLKAMHILTDRIAIAELSYGGGAVIDATGVMPASSGSEWALPMKETLSTPGYRYINRQTKELELDTFKIKAGMSKVYQKDPADIEVAKSLLRQAGMDPDKGQFPAFTITADPRGLDRATIVQQTLKASIGVTNVQIEPVDLATGNQRIAREGNFVAAAHFAYTTAPDPSPPLRSFTTDNGFYKHGFALPAMDDLFNKQRSAVDPAKRREFVYQMQRKIITGEALPTIPLVVFFGASGIIREWIKNWEMLSITGSHAYSHDRAWLER